VKINRLFIISALVTLSASFAMADSIPDTRFNVNDPSGSSALGTTITSNQFVTDGDGGFDLSGIYTGAPIYSLEFVIPSQDIIGPLSCASNVFLVLTIQPRGSNPGACYFNTTTSLGIASFFPPDLTGKDDPNGQLDCSLFDLDDCIGIQPGHFVDLSIPEGMPSAPNTPFDLAANGAAPLRFSEPGSGISLVLGLLGLFFAGRKLSQWHPASERAT
jgi:hypothetical protein